MITRSQSVATLGISLMLLGCGEAIADDCNSRISAAAAASILGVAQARQYAYAGHTKQPPNNMDVLSCGYSAATPDPYAPVMTFVVYTPVGASTAAIYSSLFRHPTMQAFATKVGLESSGGVDSKPSQGRFQAYINFRTATNVYTLLVGGLPSADAAKNAALKLAGSL